MKNLEAILCESKVSSVQEIVMKRSLLSVVTFSAKRIIPNTAWSLNK
jgi:hypothetical protein